MGCPPLRNEAYVGKQLNNQLDDQAERFLGNSIKFKIDRKSKTLYISPIFQWFEGDFVENYGKSQTKGKFSAKQHAVLGFISGYLADNDKEWLLAGDYKIKYLEYDWSLNKQD